eukprot:CAMPEP_0117756812 /NCGR_PEP_ID=MMETSP0947-20121206/14328_1 /TAXON_ID=44440 /ORGANISM="Chattonella subsalsa, Strain CCMP2191" /LENGTH=155 /DNA_ID=CAMNT_0005576525 /DNA_START=515 /DNA_END=982 /DNA_ORIENTATION=-
MKKGLTFAEAYSLPKAVVVVKALKPGSKGHSHAGPEKKVFKGTMSSSSSPRTGSMDSTEADQVPRAILAEESGVCVATPVGPDVINNPQGNGTSSARYTNGSSEDLTSPLVEATTSHSSQILHPHRDQNSETDYSPPTLLGSIPEVHTSSHANVV